MLKIISVFLKDYIKKENYKQNNFISKQKKLKMYAQKILKNIKLNQVNLEQLQKHYCHIMFIENNVK